MRQFDSPGAFARHFARLMTIGHEVTHHLAEKSAEHVEKAAKAKFGEYQGEAGPFNAWPELADSTKADRRSKGYPENEPLLREGNLRDSVTHVVEGNDAAVGSMDPVMLYQEVGTAAIPPRSVLGAAMAESRMKLIPLAAATTAAWIAGIGWKRPPQIGASGGTGSE